MRRNKKFNLLANNIVAFLLGVLTGIIFTLVFIFNKTPISHKYLNIFNKSNNNSNNKNNELSNVVNSNNIKPDNKLKNKRLQPNDHNTYEFYNLLPKMQPNTAEQPNKNNNKINKYYYYIQVGIFNKIAEADELKAKLTLQGYETIIEAQPTKLGDRYKLLIGPYSSQSIATVNKTELEHAGFKNIFIRTNKD